MKFERERATGPDKINKLNNEIFVGKEPEVIIAKERVKQAELQTTCDKLNEQVAVL